MARLRRVHDYAEHGITQSSWLGPSQVQGDAELPFIFICGIRQNSTGFQPAQGQNEHVVSSNTLWLPEDEISLIACTSRIRFKLGSA